jgi:hypothetical protein
MNPIKTIAATAFFAFFTCLLTTSVNAQVSDTQVPIPRERTRPRTSGISDQRTRVRVDFEIDASVLDVNPDNNLGFFPGAVRDFRRLGNPDAEFPSESLSITSGNITASRVTPQQLERNFGFNAFQSLRTDTRDLNANRFTSNNIVQYELTFNENPGQFFLFTPSTDSNLVNSLSAFTQITTSQGLFRRQIGNNTNIERYGFSNPLSTILLNPSTTPQTDQARTVPEPTAIFGMLIFATSVTLLRKKVGR